MRPIGGARSGTISSGGSGGSAIPASAVDNFEAALYEDQNRTLSDLYGGALSNFARQQSTVLEGAYSLQRSGASNSPTSIASTSGLPRYPDLGDTFQAQFQANRFSKSESSPFVEIGWFAQSETTFPNEYAVQMRANDTFLIIKRNNGFSTLTSGSHSCADNTAYYVEVTHDNQNSITAEVFEKSTDNSVSSQLTTTDSTWTDGGINWGWNNTSNGTHTVQYDLFEVV
jgi:hypothetical protein